MAQNIEVTVETDAEVAWLPNLPQGRVMLVTDSADWNAQTAKVWMKFKDDDGLQQVKNPHTGDAWEPTANDAIDVPSVGEVLFGISTADVSEISDLKLFALPYDQTF